MKQSLAILTLMTLFLVLHGCKEGKASPHDEMDDASLSSTVPPIERDLGEIKKDGKLRVLIAYSGTSYFLYKGRPMGYEYELLQHLADYLQLELEIIVSKNLDQLLTNLNQGTADIAAYGLAITNDRKRKVAFTDYLYLTKQVLVQRKPINWRKMTLDGIKESIVQDPLELIGDTVSVRKTTSYFKRIENLSKEIGGQIFIDTLQGDLATEEIIEMVAENKIKYTVADDNLARIHSSNHPILDVGVPVSFSQRIAWALRPNSPELLKATNTWIRQFKKEVAFNVIYNKYFKNRRGFVRRIESDTYTIDSDEISLYDDIIRKNAESIGWDWRLLAALIYQESRFENEASAWTGASGLMQLMPATAEELGVQNRLDPNQNILGGTTYLKSLYDTFEEITDTVQRSKFALAAYNCGLYHVRDAQILAKQKGLESNIWDENVERMILALSYPRNFNREEIQYGYVNGREPYNYVREIFRRYEHYTRFIELANPEIELQL